MRRLGYMKTKVRWFCKHCRNCSGEIEVDGDYLNSELIQLITNEHRLQDTIGGETWIVLNLDEDGESIISNGIFKMTMPIKEYPQPQFIILHIE